MADLRCIKTTLIQIEPKVNIISKRVLLRSKVLTAKTPSDKVLRTELGLPSENRISACPGLCVRSVMPKSAIPSVVDCIPSLYEMWGTGYVVWISSLLVLSSAALAPPQVLLDVQAQQISHDQFGAVASENRVCSQIGIDLLEAGGNAADAVGS